jgi:hypothetical protein
VTVPDGGKDTVVPEVSIKIPFASMLTLSTPSPHFNPEVDAISPDMLIGVLSSVAPRFSEVYDVGAFHTTVNSIFIVALPVHPDKTAHVHAIKPISNAFIAALPATN